MKIDIVWDIDNIFGVHKVRKLNLREFPFPNPLDFKAFIVSLRYNKWFSSLSFDGINSNAKLPKEAVICIADTLKYNSHLTHVSLPGAISKDQFQLIADSLF